MSVFKTPRGFAPVYRPWTTEDERRLRALCDGPPRTWEQIAAALGRSSGAVKARASEMGLSKAPCARGLPPWSPGDLARAQALRAAGATLQAIGEAMGGLTSSAVYQQLQKAPAGEAVARDPERDAALRRMVASAQFLAALRRHHAPGCGEFNIAPEGVPRRIFAGSIGSPGSPSALCAEL